MTAIDLQADTMQLLQRFDKTDTSLWKRILDAISAIYHDEETVQAKKRAEQKAKIREMIGVFEKRYSTPIQGHDYGESEEEYEETHST